MAKENPKEVLKVYQGKDLEAINQINVPDQLKARESVDEELKGLLSDYDITSETSLTSLKEDESIVFGYDQINDQVAQLVQGGHEVYIVGDEIRLKDLYKKLGLKISLDEKTKTEKSNKALAQQIDEVWSVVGFKNGKELFNSNIISVDIAENPINVTFDLAVQDILSFKKKLKTKGDNTRITDVSKKGIDSEVTALGYNDDTTVWAEYSVNSTYFAQNSSGTSILRAKLNADFILKRNTTADNDPTYDYFYLRENLEVSCPNGSSCGTFQDINTEHYTVYSSDNLVDWGPDGTSNVNGTEVQIGLPWGVSWTFVPNSSSGDSVDIDQSGGQTTDHVTWRAYNKVWNGLEYDIDNPTKFQPGTGWASTGTYAVLQTEASTHFRYGSTNSVLVIGKQINYDY